MHALCVTLRDYSFNTGVNVMKVYIASQIVVMTCFYFTVFFHFYAQYYFSLELSGKQNDFPSYIYVET